MQFQKSSDTNSGTSSISGNGSQEQENICWRLTSRETEIIKMINDGMSNKDIARELDVVLSTVKNHVHSILSKYQVSRRTLAAAQYRSQSEYANQEFRI